MGLKDKIAWSVRKALNHPDSFWVVEKDKDGNYVCPNIFTHVRKIGNRQQIKHLASYDMMHHTISMQMTYFRLCVNKDINAYYVEQGSGNFVDELEKFSLVHPLNLS